MIKRKPVLFMLIFILYAYIVESKIKSITLKDEII